MIWEVLGQGGEIRVNSDLNFGFLLYLAHPNERVGLYASASCLGLGLPHNLQEWPCVKFLSGVQVRHWSDWGDFVKLALLCVRSHLVGVVGILPWELPLAQTQNAFVSKKGMRDHYL